MTVRRASLLHTAPRLVLCALICTALAAILFCNTATALDLYSDYFVSLSARPLGMGGAFAAVSGPESVFHNPAGLANVRRLHLMHNHSARHFPGSTEGGMNEWDQLDSDTQCLTVPLPLCTYAHGFVLQGEMGYDFRGHPEGGLGYPRERYWGTESYDSVAASLGLPVAAGVSLRRHVGRFSPDRELHPEQPAWLRLGEGQQWGFIARAWPGLDYGRSELKMKYEWTALESDADGAPAEFSSRQKQRREGWALRPAAWLCLASDQQTEQWIYEDRKNPGQSAAYAGRVHMGDRKVERLMRGAELNIGNLLWLRRGDNDGHPTVGLSFNLLGLQLNYAEIEGLLPKIVGEGSGFENVHIYGFDLPLT